MGPLYTREGATRKPVGLFAIPISALAWAALFFVPLVLAGQVSPVIEADRQRGTTADAKIANACAALPSTGGTIDARGFGATTQLVADQISCGSAGKPVTFRFDPSTIFQAATSSQNVWQIEPGNVIRGFTFDCTNQPSYSGTVLQNDTTVPFLNSNNGHNTSIEDFQVTYSCRSIGAGSAFQLRSTSSSTGVAFVSMRHARINGLRNGISLIASGTGYVNGNIFTDVAVSSTVNGWNYSVSGTGTVGGNICVSCSYEQISNGSYALLWQGTSGSLQYNLWEGNSWDTATYANLSATVMTSNIIDIRADGSCSGNCPSALGDTTYNTLINRRFAGTSAAYYWGSYGGVWLTSHSGNGIRFNVSDLSKTFHLYPNASGLMQLDGVSIGTAAEFNPAGPGAVMAGTGAGTFYGANLYSGSGAGLLSIPVVRSNASISYQSGSYTSGDVVSYHGTTGQQQDSAVAVANVLRYCGTAVFSSSTTSGALSCAWVTAGSHCQATWIGSVVSGGALGYTASSASVTLTAATSNSGTAAVHCSVN
jgi:hypothetical protein